jgi:hypothetical protein
MPLNKTPQRPKQREAIYDVLDGERDYQDEIHPEAPTLATVYALLAKYTEKLGMLSAGNMDKTRKRLRQIAAIAIKGMEHHGASPRENHVPASASITGEMHLTGPLDAL